MSDKYLGLLGERLTKRYFEKKGYQVLGCNLHSRLGEVDILVVIDKTLVFVEVKSRSAGSKSEPEEAFNWPKRKRFLGTVKYLLPRYSNFEKYRIDVVCLKFKGYTHVSEFRHYENVITL